MGGPNIPDFWDMWGITEPGAKSDEHKAKRAGSSSYKDENPRSLSNLDRKLRHAYFGTFFPNRKVGDADIRHVYCGFASRLSNSFV